MADAAERKVARVMPYCGPHEDVDIGVCEEEDPLATVNIAEASVFDLCVSRLILYV